MRAISLRDAAIEVAQFSLALGTVGGVIGFIGGVVLKNDSMDGCTFTECGAIGGVLAPLGAAAYSWAHEQWVEPLLTKLHGLTLERIWLGGAAICGLITAATAVLGVDRLQDHRYTPVTYLVTQNAGHPGR